MDDASNDTRCIKMTDDYSQNGNSLCRVQIIYSLLYVFNRHNAQYVSFPKLRIIYVLPNHLITHFHYFNFTTTGSEYVKTHSRHVFL